MDIVHGVLLSVARHPASKIAVSDLFVLSFFAIVRIYLKYRKEAHEWGFTLILGTADLRRYAEVNMSIRPDLPG